MFTDNLKKTELVERIRWLILLRWVAISGLFITTYVFSSVFMVVKQVIPLYGIGMIIGFINVCYYSITDTLHKKTFRSVQLHAGIQIMTDHFFLVCLIYFAGGIENPFIIYFLFHAIIGGIFLEKKYSYMQALFATSLFALLLVLEYYSVIPHQPLQIFSAFRYSDDLWHSEVYILCVFFALASTIFISVYFVTSLMDRLRKSRGDVLFEVRSTLENMAEGVIFIDPSDKVTMCNREIEKTWKVKSEEIINKSVKDDQIPYVGGVASKITERFKKGIETSQHQEVKTEGGFLYNTYSAVFDPTGKYWGTVITSHDITERKKLEQQLLHSERLATIGEMSAKVAHEIRNPLSSISLNTELLYDEISKENGEEKSEAENLIQSILSEVDTLTEMSDEYLRFARFPRLDTKPVSVNNILIELSKFFNKERLKRGITLKENYAPDLPLILLDVNQIKQAFLNILKNSFEAMSEGGKLSISTRLKDDCIEVSITDTGSGISKEDVQRVFDPFYSAKVNGTGLGLALTMKTVEGHHGEIICKSTIDKGTTMVVSFPVETCGKDIIE
ncbi:MAG: ATP-binding protein [Candidatus Scalindua sp.]|nr:ATP-binding protein [Candidatus Scalindua sp.]MDV5165710.1 ATP-binding protein [Candidatus Scalindua sp.]